jgi:hypothetical protein
MPLNIVGLAGILFMGTVLSGCAQTKSAPRADLVDTPASPIMEYKWQSDYARVIEAPAEIVATANKTCLARGFDKSFMLSISTDAAVSTALFSCRGSD